MRFMFLLSWVRNIFVALVMCVSCSFVLEVFFMIVCKHILMGGRFWFCYLTCTISKILIDQMSLLIFIDVHISNWRHLLLFFFSTSCSSPMSLDTLNMPLINNSYNILPFTFFIKISKDQLISNINNNFFLFWG